MADAQFSVPTEIDIATAAQLRQDVFDRIDRSDTPVVHIDLAAVTFIDSAGYHALVAASDYAARRGRVLIIWNLTAFCAAVLRLCDRDDELHIAGHSSGRRQPGANGLGREPGRTAHSIVRHRPLWA